ncbi:unnamed protein product [Victoria cruziana]
MGAAALPTWGSEPCMMGIDEAGRGPVLGPMVYGCLYCPFSYKDALSSLNFADSKTLKEEKREELFENLRTDDSIGWAVDVIDSRVYVDTVGDAEKYRIKLSEKFPGIKFVVAKKADSIYPVVSGASIVAKVTRDRALREWVFDETAENMNRNFGSGYPGDPETKAWLNHHKHSVFGFPSLVRFSWGTCSQHCKDIVEVIWESDAQEDDECANSNGKRQLKLINIGITGSKKGSEEVESSAKGRCKFFQARKLEQVAHF